VEKSLAGWVIRERQPAVVEDAETDPRMYTVEPDSDICSIVAVPMYFGDECIGVLESLTHEKPHHFTPQDVDTLTTLAGNAAVAVQNARLFQQTDWIAEIVHEIRTPLTAIMSYADLLNHPQIDVETKAGFIEVIQRETERVHKLVNQFLELARLESGRMTFSQKPFTINKPIINAVQTIRPRAEKRGMEISIDVPDTLPDIIGDAGRIEQVLLNLLSNAVKYAAPNTTIQVRSFQNKDALHVTVTDRGPGISPEHLSRLFQKFSRLPGSEEQATGSGLGLHISRQIVEAHGGEIWAESEPGVGSTFAFTLPL
jgi:signal transduction histidine kinase